MNLLIRFFISCAFVFCAFSLTGCASIINGTRQKVKVTSEPAGAIVSDGKNCWTTPATISLPRKQAHPLFISKAGYKMQSLRLRQVASAAILGNILLPGGLIGLGIDTISGAQFNLVPDKLHIRLKSLDERDAKDKKSIYRTLVDKVNEIVSAI